jgi:xanthine dehydrogenase accessory factor
LRNLIETLCQFLETGEDLVVATILSSRGSAPRTAGTKMIIRANGDIFGTIGGGLIEARAQQTAPEVYASRQSQSYVFDMTGAQAADMDMICGGEVEVLLEHIPATPDNLALFHVWHKALHTGRECLLVTPLKRTDGQQSLQRCLLQADTTSEGPGALPPEVAEALWLQSKNVRYPLIIHLPQGSFYIEPCFVPATLYLFGAGHVCRPTAELASMVGFNTVILDDRAEFANRERFPQASEIRVVSSYDDCMLDLAIDRYSYLVIISRGHRHDQDLLRQALRTEAGYIGMIGSRGKRDKIYRNLLAEGASQQALDQVYSPIGIAIEAETPEEIAVSIVGELIQVRARNQAQHG